MEMQNEQQGFDIYNSQRVRHLYGWKVMFNGRKMAPWILRAGPDWPSLRNPFRITEIPDPGLECSWSFPNPTGSNRGLVQQIFSDFEIRGLGDLFMNAHFPLGSAPRLCIQLIYCHPVFEWAIDSVFCSFHEPLFRLYSRSNVLLGVICLCRCCAPPGGCSTRVFSVCPVLEPQIPGWNWNFLDESWRKNIIADTEAKKFEYQTGIKIVVAYVRAPTITTQLCENCILICI